MNALVMYDHQTDTLWSHFTGDAVQGQFKGDKLQILPALHTTWGQWLALHPDTVALDKFGYGSRDGYTSYYDSNQTGIIGETVRDDRLAPKTLVAAVSIGDQHRAYSVGDLREQSVVNDTLADVPLLVVYHAGSATSAVFEREVDGALLEFTALPVDCGGCSAGGRPGGDYLARVERGGSGGAPGWGGTSEDADALFVLVCLEGLAAGDGSVDA